MTETVIVAILSLLGTSVGSILGIMTANKLTVYRIEQLEKKVDKHNSVIERTTIIERDVKTAFNRIDEMKEDIRELIKKEESA